MIDHQKRTIVPMFGLSSGRIEFEVIVYGRTADELSVVPNEIIHHIARRFPNHTSSPFAIETIGNRSTRGMKRNMI